MEHAIIIGQTVPHRYARVFCQFLYDLLAKAPVLDAVIHPAENSCRIPDAFFLPDLRSLGIQICGPHAHIVGSDLKGTPGAGTGLFKDQRHIFAPVIIYRDTLFLFILQFCGQIQKICDLFRCKIF